MDKLKDMTLEEFARLTASDEPAPGGGSVSAYVGVLSAALAAMMANLTIGKEKYAGVWDEMRTVADRGEALCAELMEAMERDRNSFTGYMTALRMPKDTEEQKAARRAAMQSGLIEATKIPLAAAETAMKVFELSEAVVRRGNASAVTDGAASALLARSAVLGILLNVKINLGSIRDEELAAEMRKRMTELEQEAERREKEILSLMKV